MICLENVGFECLGQEMHFPKITGYSMQCCDLGVRRPELLHPNCGDRRAGNIWGICERHRIEILSAETGKFHGRNLPVSALKISLREGVNNDIF